MILRLDPVKRFVKLDAVADGEMGGELGDKEILDKKIGDKKMRGRWMEAEWQGMRGQEI